MFEFHIFVHELISAKSKPESVFNLYVNILNHSIAYVDNFVNLRQGMKMSDYTVDCRLHINTVLTAIKLAYVKRLQLTLTACCRLHATKCM